MAHFLESFLLLHFEVEQFNLISINDKFYQSQVNKMDEPPSLNSRSRFNPSDGISTKNSPLSNSKIPLEWVIYLDYFIYFPK